jgi:hypothetical protein
MSYAPCCEDSPNYDSSADTAECDLYSACDFGQFAYSGQKSFNWVQSNNIIAFFSSFGDNKSFRNKMMRRARLWWTLVVDTCGDSDCNGCCLSNPEPSRYLVDMEYWTVVNNFGDISTAQGQICWQLMYICIVTKPAMQSACQFQGDLLSMRKTENGGVFP